MRTLILIFLALGALTSVQLGHAANLVRFNLGKTVRPQNGPQGQPLISYYANIGVGTPLKEFKMLVDINAREIWLPHFSRVGQVLSRLNYADGYAKKHSSTSVKENDVYTIVYHNTKLSGKAYSDVFELRNVTESIAAPRWQQRFLAISGASNGDFGGRGVDGVLSISPWPISEAASDMMSVGLKRAKLMNELKAGLLLDQDLSSGSGGELTFGGFNPTKFLGILRYHQSVNKYAWELNLSAVMLGAETLGCVNDKCTALISTSRNDIYGPAEQVKRILKFFGHTTVDDKFDENKLYDIDCLEVSKAPILTIVIDDAYYMLHPSAYIRKKTMGMIFKSEGCYIAILSSGFQDKWELGTNFVSNYYTVFDLNLTRVAFAQRPQI